MLALLTSTAFSAERSDYDTGIVGSSAAGMYLTYIPTDKACESAMGQVVSWLDQYHLDAKYSEGGATSEITAKIHKILREAQSQSERCFRDVSAAYAIGSISRLSNDIWMRHLSLFAIVIHNAGILNPLTPQLRQSMGGIWPMRENGGKSYKILGGFDCLGPRVYYEPLLSPFDVGAVLVHEMDHLLRDRLVLSQLGLNAREFTLLDETLALFHAGFLQIQMRLKEPTYESRINIFGFIPKLRSYDIPNDLQMYAPNGQLYHLMEEHWDWYDSRSHLGFNFFTDRVFSNSKDVKDSKALEGLLQKVSVAYFKNEFGAVSSVVAKMPNLASKLNLIDPWLGEQFKDWSNGRGDFDGVSEKILSQILQPSTSCRQFQEALTQGELDDYLGKSPKANSPGQKPGSEGVRTDDNGVKPGSEGVRTDTTVKPCVMPPRGF